MAREDTGRVAVVVGVGASQGLGGALCRRFAAEGLHTFVAGRTAQKIEAVAKEITESGGTATPVVTDATVESDVVRLMDTAKGEGGSLDLVAYNAGNMRMGNVADMEADSFQETWTTGCFGGFLAGREAARRMVPQGSGTLIFTGATASLRARPPFTAFASAKAALRALAFGMAREFGPQGVHVGHVVVDGAIRGEQLLSRMPQLAERMGEDGMLDIDAIADAYWALHLQDRTAWTLELDLRPYKENF